MDRALLHNAILLVTFLLLPFLQVAPATAQISDDPTLHIPPVLRVEVAGNYRKALNALYRSESETQLGDRLSLEVEYDVNNALLLPMIFFDQGSELPSPRFQYFIRRSQVLDYREESAIDMTLFPHPNPDILKYHQILNIIGSRMDRYRLTTISLEPGYAAQDGESSELAEERAEVIRDYFVSIWGIDPNRIHLMPPRRMADQSDNFMKQEEARRVIIHADDWKLIRPVEYEEYQINIEPVVFSFHIEPKMPADQIASVEIAVANGDEMLSTNIVQGHPDSTVYRLIGVWIIPRHPDRLEEGLTVQSSVRNYQGKTHLSNQVRIPIEIQQVGIPQEESDDRSRDEYDGSIIFFESGDTSLNQHQRLFLERRVATLLGELEENYDNGNVVLHCTGYCDASELPAFNEALAANLVAQGDPRSRFLGSIFNDPSYTVPFMFMPAADPENPRMPFRDLDERLGQAWFPDRYDELMEVRDRSYEIYSPNLDLEEIARADSMMVSRAGSVANYLLDHFDQSRVDTILTGSGLDSEWVDFYKSPEERFFNRYVYIGMSRAYEDEGFEEIEE